MYEHLLPKLNKITFKFKQRGAQNTIKKLIVNDKEITDQIHILECIMEFYGTIFIKSKQKTPAEIKSFIYSKAL